MAFHTGPEIPCIKVQEAPQSVPKAYYIGLTMMPEGKTRGGGHVVVTRLRSDVQSIYYIIFGNRGSKTFHVSKIAQLRISRIARRATVGTVDTPCRY